MGIVIAFKFATVVVTATAFSVCLGPCSGESVPSTATTRAMEMTKNPTYAAWFQLMRDKGSGQVVSRAEVVRRMGEPDWITKAPLLSAREWCYELPSEGFSSAPLLFIRFDGDEADLFSFNYKEATDVRDGRWVRHKGN